MLERIVGLSIRQRWFVLAIVALLSALGVAGDSVAAPGRGRLSSLANNLSTIFLEL